MPMSTLSNLLPLLLLGTPLSVSAQEKACVTGYPMDNFCIQRGTLLDNPSLATLPNVDRHTIHCLVDVGICIRSGYKIMTEPTADSGGDFIQAYELDTGDSQEMMLADARRLGSCGTCSGEGNQRAGYRATFVGTVDPDYNLSPPRLLLEEIHPHTVTCESLLQEDTPDETTAPSMSPTELSQHPRFCFSGNNSVEVQNKGPTPIIDLKIGDSVQVGPNKFERIYSFGHKDESIVAEYLQVKTANNEVLELTPDHMVFSEGKAIPASMLKAGNSLDLADGGAVGKVESVRNVHGAGVFAPFTPSGKIVVGGIVASTFTTLEEESADLTIGGVSTGISYQWIGLAFETPFRLVCSRFGSCPGETYTEAGLSTRLTLPVQAGAWFAEQSSVFAQTLFVIPVLSILVFFNAVELLLTMMTRWTVVLPSFCMMVLMALTSRVINVRVTKTKQN